MGSLSDTLTVRLCRLLWDLFRFPLDKSAKIRYAVQQSNKTDAMTGRKPLPMLQRAAGCCEAVRRRTVSLAPEHSR